MANQILVNCALGGFFRDLPGYKMVRGINFKADILSDVALLQKMKVNLRRNLRFGNFLLMVSCLTIKYIGILMKMTCDYGFEQSIGSFALKPTS
jgi:hypothetical protein